MNLTNMFENIIESSKSTSTTTSSNTDDEKANSSFPIRDSATLNMLLYKNERYNRRELPRNDDKKPLYEIVKNQTVELDELNTMINRDIDDLKSKTWSQIPINVRKQLIQEYCEKNDIEITESKLKTILKDRTLVKYSKTNKCIEQIKL